jgi:hypothetical protein
MKENIKKEKGGEIFVNFSNFFFLCTDVVVVSLQLLKNNTYKYLSGNSIFLNFLFSASFSFSSPSFSLYSTSKRNFLNPTSTFKGHRYSSRKAIKGNLIFFRSNFLPNFFLPSRHRFCDLATIKGK